MADDDAGLRLENVADDILREHLEIVEVVATIRRQRTAQDALAKLEPLVRTLPDHFCDEESEDGVFWWISYVFPSLEPRVAFLAKEHSSLLEHARVTVDAMKRGEEDWSTALTEFIDRFVVHELTERLLLNEAITGSVKQRATG